MRRATVLLLAALCGGCLESACGSTQSSEEGALRPTEAPSLAVVDPVFEREGRVVEVFLRDGLSGEERQKMAAEIATLPGVIGYAYVSEAVAIGRVEGTAGRPLKVPRDLLPSSFLIATSSREATIQVAERFYGDARVENEDGGHDGVVY